MNTTNTNSQNYAPVVLIAFNRPEHTKKAISALAQNIGAKDTELYCFIDGARNADEVDIQKTIVDIVNKNLKYFKSICIIQRKANLGLAKNIIQAVTEVISKHGKVIVLEDDIVTSKAFLKFMNDALHYYKHEKKIWHIAAHTELNFEQRKNEIFLWRVMNCWGWATWQNRWRHFEKNPELLIDEFSEQMIREFDLNRSGKFWSQVIANAENKINTWAIFWYATIFKHGGLCVNPYLSYAANIGFDGSGVHCGADERRMVKQLLNQNGKFIGKTEIVEDFEALALMRKAYLSKKSVRYYMHILMIKFFSKEILKKILMKF